MQETKFLCQKTRSSSLLFMLPWWQWNMRMSVYVRFKYSGEERPCLIDINHWKIWVVPFTHCHKSWWWWWRRWYQHEIRNWGRVPFYVFMQIYIFFAAPDVVREDKGYKRSLCQDGQNRRWSNQRRWLEGLLIYSKRVWDNIYKYFRYRFITGRVQCEEAPPIPQRPAVRGGNPEKVP